MESAPWVLIGVVLLGEALARGGRRPESRGADRGSLAVISLLMAAGYTAAFRSAARAPEAVRLGPWAVGAGAALAVGGVLLRLWAVRTLGRYFTRVVRVSSDQPVVDTGPYRAVRHPAYTGTLLSTAGVGLSFRWPPSLAWALAGCLPGLLYRIRVEEAALADAIGEPYRDYRRRTKRLVPFVW